MEFALPAQRDITLTKMEYAVRFIHSVNFSTARKEFAKAVIKDMKLEMDSVNQLTWLTPRKEDARSEKKEYAFSVPGDGTWILLQKFVMRFQIYVEPGIKSLELVKVAIQASSLKIGNV